jgi:hypothetical protein
VPAVRRGQGANAYGAGLPPGPGWAALARRGHGSKSARRRRGGMVPFIATRYAVRGPDPLARRDVSVAETAIE